MSNNSQSIIPDEYHPIYQTPFLPEQTLPFESSLIVSPNYAVHSEYYSHSSIREDKQFIQDSHSFFSNGLQIIDWRSPSPMLFLRISSKNRITDINSPREENIREFDPLHEQNYHSSQEKLPNDFQNIPQFTSGISFHGIINDFFPKNTKNTRNTSNHIQIYGLNEQSLSSSSSSSGLDERQVSEEQGQSIHISSNQILPHEQQDIKEGRREVPNQVEQQHIQEQKRSIYILPGDFVLDLSPLYILLSKYNNGSIHNLLYNVTHTPKKHDFMYSSINIWKHCSFIEKDSADNGCFYLTINDKIDSNSAVTSPDLLKAELENLLRTKQSLDSQMAQEVKNEFSVLFSRFYSQVNSISTFIDQCTTHIPPNCLQYLDESQKLEMLLNAERQAKAIMKDIVNIHGSNKSFVFGKIITLNSSMNIPHTDQYIFSPKLVSILFGTKKRNGALFVNQIMRKGLIDFLGEKGQFMINSLEIAVLSSQISPNLTRQKQSLKANSKLSLTLHTIDGLSVPITVTMKKHPLLEADSNTSNIHSHLLLVIDIKVKIKYQKQIKQFREAAQLSVKLNKSNKSTRKIPKYMKKIQNDQILHNKQPTTTSSEQNTPSSESQSDVSLKYYEESFIFLNKFYPEYFKSNEISSEKETKNE